MADQGVFLDSYLRERGPVHYSKVARIAADLLTEIDRRDLEGQLDSVLLIHPGRIRISGGNVELVNEPAAEPADPERIAYCSPEELQGRSVDVRGALYSLGCTLFELLTGRKPYPSGDARKIRDAHLNAPIPDPRDVSVRIPVSLSNLVRELLSKKPELRPATPVEVLDQIHACLGLDPQVEAQAVPTRRPAAPGARKSAPRGGRPSRRRSREPQRASSRGRGEARESRVREKPRSGARRSRLAAGIAARGKRRGAAHGRSRREPEYEPDYDEQDESEDLRYRIERPQPILTYIGIGVGVAFALMLLLRGFYLRSALPEMRREAREERSAVHRQEVIAKRRNQIAREFVEAETEAAKHLRTKLGLVLPTTRMKIGVLKDMVDMYYFTPSGRKMSEEIVRLQKLVDSQPGQGLRPRSPEATATQD